MDTYTELIKTDVFELLERDAAMIKNELSTIFDPETADRSQWKDRLTKIAQDYCLSSRFALMRILSCRAHALDVASADDSIAANGFDWDLSGERVSFKDISIDHAKELSAEENIRYTDCLNELAKDRPDFDNELNMQIISQAWHDVDSANSVSEYLLSDEIRDNKKLLKEAKKEYTRKNNAAYKKHITRDEAFRLGHVLGLSLTEMEWFMLRVLSEDEGFSLRSSNDLIEAYGFLSGSSFQHVDELKARYRARCGAIPKARSDGQERGWTKNVSDTFAQKVESWLGQPETADDSFLDWLEAQAPMLDMPSRTVERIYCNLAAFAYELMTGADQLGDDSELADCIQDILRETELTAAADALLCENGVRAYAKCKQAADALLLENKVQAASVQADNTKAWHILSVRDDGSLTAAGGIVQSGRSRVADILYGSVQAEKSDMLYLLWFIVNLAWQTADAADSGVLCCRILDLMDIANDVLKAAMLPAFYPPHVLEQSMLLSIAYSNDEDDASVVYEYILYAFTKRRNRETGSKRHSSEFKLEAVRYYRSHPEQSLDGCAAMFEIAPQTLSAWQKELADSGII